MTTHFFFGVFNECITPWLAFERSRLVEEEIEFRHSPKLGEDMEQRVSAGSVGVHASLIAMKTVRRTRRPMDAGFQRIICL
jgi:hypothetical protein